MKNQSWLFTLFIASLGYGARPDACSTSSVLTQIRPGAAWSMSGDSMDHLNWLDTKQKKPSKAEVEKARVACMADSKSRDALKKQARLELKDPNTPVEKKVNDLILLLDLDR